MYTPICDFLLIQDRLTCELYVRGFGDTSLRKAVDPYGSYLVGYRLSAGSETNLDGEFIALSYDLEGWAISTDFCGSLSLYVVEEGSKTYISTLLPAILGRLEGTVSLDYERLHQYFAFGYQVIDPRSHFKNVMVYQQPLLMRGRMGDVQLDLKERALFQSKCKVEWPEARNNVEQTILKRLASCNPDAAIFAMSGGKDTLLSALLLKKNGYRFDTATFGSSGSTDVEFGRSRSEKIFGRTHASYLVKDWTVTSADLVKHANMQSGHGTLMSIYFNKYFSELESPVARSILFSEHWEATRKMPRTVHDVRSKYVTPKHVVDSYFLDRHGYESSIDSALELILDTYGNRAIEQFYFFDRNVRGQHWKAPIARQYGLVKTNFAYDETWLNQNYWYLEGHGFYYEEILEWALAATGLSPDGLVPQYTPDVKDIPISPIDMLYDFHEALLSFIEVGLGQDIARVFDLEEIARRIRHRTIRSGDEWFVMRLMNLLAFSGANSIPLSF